MLLNCCAREDSWETLDSKEIQPVNPKETNPEYSLKGLMMKLKFQYFVHLMQRGNSLEKTLMLGKIKGGRRGDDRGWDGWVESLTWWHEFEQALGVGDGQRSLACCCPFGCKESDTAERLNWIELNWTGIVSNQNAKVFSLENLYLTISLFSFFLKHFIYYPLCI